MGNCLASCRRRKLKRHIVLIMIGLDNAGKTKTVNNLVGDNDEKVIPTVGFKAVNLIHKDVPVTIYDLGGSPNFRQIWPQYYSEVHGVIFVIDSSDFSRLDECRAVLEEVLSHDKISGKPVLVLANKQDKQGALDDIDVVEKLHIEPLVNKYRCPTLVESYSATIDPRSKKNKPRLDPGLKKGYQWLLNYIVRRYGDMNLRVQTDIHAELERRKILINKPAIRASQTFTASDEITTQTGFDNPTYEMRDRPPDPPHTTAVSSVRPLTTHNSSLESTITIESVEDSELTSGAKPKLSPMYGQPSDNSTLETGLVETSGRSGSGAGRGTTAPDRGDERGVCFNDRPHSSPTAKKKRAPSPPKTWYEADKLEMLHLNTRADVSSKCQSDVMMVRRADSPESVVRPMSASAALRRQLEVQPAVRRRLSLRYMQRNRLMPERMGGGSKGDGRRNYLSRGDVTI